ncbi:MAG TPA: hypothetical protein PLN61_06870 [bacterium]|nr:hypothetical protein [bacterium]HQI48373.1 hypothetical protein [bacterium]HQJ63754.1 hypothetical protein [bacterium]
MRSSMLFVALGLVLLTLTCSKEQGYAPLAPSDQDGVMADASIQAFARTLAEQAGWPVEASGEELAEAGLALAKGGVAPLMDFERTLIANDIAHYSVRLRVGPGTYDVIGLHRVVREKRPYQPLKTRKSIFFQHGSSKTFAGMWLPGLASPSTPDDFGMGVFLARHDIDVWGIDQAWALVPASESNTDFMIDWGLERQVGDLRTAVAVARLTRILTGCGDAKMILAGFSNGVPTTVSLVNEESQLPAVRRHVGGYIPIDCAIKVAEGAPKEAMKSYVAAYQAIHDGGVYGEQVMFALMADKVRNDPDGHDFDATLTNVEFVLTVVTGPTLFPGHPFHYWAGVWADGKPAGLRFTDRELWLDFLASGTAYEPIIWTVEWCGYVAGVMNTSYDDHLGDIRIPILNLTPAGGFAEATRYGLSLLGSRDIETLMPSMGLPAEEEFAHIDLFTAPEAEHLVWQPMLRWINAHTPANR